MGGRFISLEGGEGAGKSTQAKSLAAVLRARGLEVVETREPGGSPGAEAIRALLLEGAVERWTPASEALLFAAARADHVERLIRPALARGAWVIADRFLDSSLAYQGGAGGIGMAAVRRLHRIGSGDLLPDRTLLLRLDAGEATGRGVRRDRGNPDRFGRKQSDYHARVSRAFDRLARADPERIRPIDASGDADQVTIRLLDAIEDLLP